MVWCACDKLPADSIDIHLTFWNSSDFRIFTIQFNQLNLPSNKYPLLMLHISARNYHSRMGWLIQMSSRFTGYYYFVVQRPNFPRKDLVAQLQNPNNDEVHWFGLPRRCAMIVNYIMNLFNGNNKRIQFAFVCDHNHDYFMVSFWNSVSSNLLLFLFSLLLLIVLLLLINYTLIIYWIWQSITRILNIKRFQSSP